MKFKPGDHVICIDDTVYNDKTQVYYLHWLKLGQTYVVREPRMVNGREGLYLEGIFNLFHPLFKEECGYWAFHFAKAPRREQDVRSTADHRRAPAEV